MNWGDGASETCTGGYWFPSHKYATAGTYNVSVVKDGAPAPESDYTITEGKLIFHNRGIYTVTMTNDAIESYHENPAKVIVTVNVYPVGIEENQLSDIKVYPNPTTGMLQITSYELQITDVIVYDIYGRMQKAEGRMQKAEGEMVMDIRNLPAGVYFLSINGKTTKVVKN